MINVATKMYQASKAIKLKKSKPSKVYGLISTANKIAPDSLPAEEHVSRSTSPEINGNQR
jgi:hypothetical protein